MQTPDPIFFGYTRSFWAGVLPALLVALDVAVTLLADPAAGPPVAGLIARLLGLDPAEVEGAMLRLAPVFALLVAWQRAGSGAEGRPPRPYTIDPRAK